MKDFYEQQLKILEEAHKDWVHSGLVLDILNLHVTRAGTSGVRKGKDLINRYQHISNIQEIIQKLKDLYLLAPVGKNTSLAHDTLAPVILNAFNNSFYPGQVAHKILTFKQMNIGDSKTVIYPEDLKKSLSR